MECECLMWRECEIMCRHSICVAKQDKRFASLLESPCSACWHNAKFTDVFKDFEVIMPSDLELHACTGEQYPGPYEMPDRVAQRGRPRKLRRKSKGEQFRRLQRARTGDGIEDKRRQCTVCRSVGHTKAKCPLKARYTMMKKA